MLPIEMQRTILARAHDYLIGWMDGVRESVGNWRRMVCNPKQDVRYVACGLDDLIARVDAMENIKRAGWQAHLSQHKEMPHLAGVISRLDARERCLSRKVVAHAAGYKMEMDEKGLRTVAIEARVLAGCLEILNRKPRTVTA